MKTDFFTFVSLAMVALKEKKSIFGNRWLLGVCHSKRSWIFVLNASICVECCVFGKPGTLLLWSLQILCPGPIKQKTLTKLCDVQKVVVLQMFLNCISWLFFDCNIESVCMGMCFQIRFGCCGGWKARLSRCIYCVTLYGYKCLQLHTTWCATPYDLA